MNQEVAIVSALRTPFDKFGGVLKDVSSIDLGVEVLKAVTKRVNLSPDLVEEVYYGTCVHAEVSLDQNVPARQALLKAGFRPQTLSVTIDRACCSSMLAVEMAYKSILNGEVSVAIAAGTENMSRTPYLVNGARWGKKLGHITMQDLLFELGYKEWNPVAVDAGEVAIEHNVSREEQDEWAFISQQRYAQAKEQSKFQEEVVPIQIPFSKDKAVLAEDQQARPDTTIEKLAKLQPVYGSPTVTAGNAPGMNAGASAILLMSCEKARELGLIPLAVIRSAASVADIPRDIAKLPALVIEKILQKSKLDLNAIDLIEINEAFAAMPLVSIKLLAKGDSKLEKRLRNITNVNGGAIAIGHPMGASGARLVMTLMYELIRRGGGKGIAAICGGLAQGDAVLIETV